MIICEFCGESADTSMFEAVNSLGWRNIHAQALEDGVSARTILACPCCQFPLGTSFMKGVDGAITLVPGGDKSPHKL
jgi:hypothetical protein